MPITEFVPEKPDPPAHPTRCARPGCKKPKMKPPKGASARAAEKLAKAIADDPFCQSECARIFHGVPLKAGE